MQALVHGDPIIAALPPETDYITYLTILEYQLNGKNLPTLNKLLNDDDGTLASEIGWDLLKIVLPLIQVVPDDANECFMTIAKRGNPREVIVRVAEELEHLGHDDELSALESDAATDEDELPTFAGEAERIHLGSMKLDGMPDATTGGEKKEEVQQEEIDADQVETKAGAGADANDTMSLKALLSMLSVLHPRIKTRYPSRFMATSLPAALGAYRRLPMTKDTTIAFLELLAKLSGKQRPALPPRISTAEVSVAPTAGSASAQISAVQLPDPEAQSEPNQTNKAIEKNEKAIIARLLQAVSLEILEEYINSFLSQDIIQMQWTSRLRERMESGKVLPRRPTIMSQWEGSEELKARDEVMGQILKLTRDLSLNADQALDDIFSIGSPAENDAEEEPKTDYPQSPSDIPFPASALYILQAVRQFYSEPSISALPTSKLLKQLASKHTLSESPSVSLLDTLLSLIYVAILDKSEPTDPSSERLSQSDVLTIIDELVSVFTTSPDEGIRDNAHYVAKLLLEKHADRNTKLSAIKSLLKTNASGNNAIISIQAGNLKSIGVDWLKENFLRSARPSPPPDSKPAQFKDDILDASIIATDTELASLLFPNLPLVPAPFISSHPPHPRDSQGTSTAQDAQTPISTEADLESFLLHIPFYISSLNLITILFSISNDAHRSGQTDREAKKTRTGSNGSVENDEKTSFVSSPSSNLSNPTDKIDSFVATLETWQQTLTVLLMARNQQSTQTGPLGTSDIYALEDAINRAKACTKQHLPY